MYCKISLHLDEQEENLLPLAGGGRRGAENNVKGMFGINHDTTRNRVSIAYAKQLRTQQTDAERKIWTLLKTKQLEGYKFRRQHPVGKYIVDFVCLKRMLIIELDGGQHAEEKNMVYDAYRTMFLEKAGYRVIRFWNNDVMEKSEGVLHIILENLYESPPSQPPPVNRGRSNTEREGEK